MAKYTELFAEHNETIKAWEYLMPFPPPGLMPG